MKVKVKYTNTRKFMVTLDNPTVGNLKEEIRKFVETVYKESVREPLAVSLNGTDCLEGSEDASLQSLGVVPGDLLSVLAISSNVQGEGVRTEVKSGGAKNTEGQPKTACPKPHLSPQKCAAASSDQENKLKMEEKPRYLLEARDGEPPTSLEEMMLECQPSSVSQAINLLVHLTMLECGFQSESGSGPPAGWQEIVATFRYNSPAFLGFQCTVVLVTMGEVKQVLASFPQQESEIAVRLVMKDYMRVPVQTPVSSQDLVRVSQLARTLRDRLLHPLQISAHQSLGVPAPWHLAGLPHELLLQIASLLDYRYVLALRETCRRLHSAMDDNKIWLNLYKRDFLSLYEGNDCKADADWKAKYQEAVRRRKEWSKMVDDGMTFVTPGFYPNPGLPYHPSQPYHPGQPYPGMPRPRGPNPNPPQPHPVPNPFFDPDSPYFSGELPPMPGAFPELPDPLGPLGPLRPHPGNPFQPSFMPPRPRNPRGPRFDFF